MTPEAKRALLRVARESVTAAADGIRAHLPDDLPGDPVLFENGAAFVTLHDRFGAVRGCVGTTSAVRPLVEVVSEMARAAALRDPRFEPVRSDEVGSLELDISVLGAPEPIDSVDDIQIGRDGLIVDGRGHRGLLLPQVAVERDWSAMRFLEQTCMKAGLDPEAHRADDISIFRFGAEVFSEADQR